MANPSESLCDFDKSILFVEFFSDNEAFIAATCLMETFCEANDSLQIFRSQQIVNHLKGIHPLLLVESHCLSRHKLFEC